VIFKIAEVIRGGRREEKEEGRQGKRKLGEKHTRGRMTGYILVETIGIHEGKRELQVEKHKTHRGGGHCGKQDANKVTLFEKY